MPRTSRSKRNAADLPKKVMEAIEGRTAAIDSGDLLRNLIDVWGGSRQLAIDIHFEFQKAQAGSMTRQRILEMFQRLIITTTQDGVARAARPEDMSTEELATMASRLLGKASNGTSGPAAGPGPPPDHRGGPAG